MFDWLTGFRFLLDLFLRKLLQVRLGPTKGLQRRSFDMCFTDQMAFLSSNQQCLHDERVLDVKMPHFLFFSSVGIFYCSIMLWRCSKCLDTVSWANGRAKLPYGDFWSVRSKLLGANVEIYRLDKNGAYCNLEITCFLNNGVIGWIYTMTRCSM